MSNQDASGNSPARWRTVVACRRCRQRKVKCSGTAPCRNCASRRQACIFDEVDRRIVISERHLRELERRAKGPYGRSPRSANEGNSRGAREQMHDESDRIGQHSSFTADHNEPLPHIEARDSPLRIIQNSNGTDTRNKKAHSIRHLATWDFSRQLNEILRVESNESSSSPRKSYKIPLWDDEFPNCLESTLAPKHHIIHLAHVVDFHMNTHHHIFRIADLISQINGTSSLAINTMFRTWKVKLLMITALGKLFLEKGGTTSRPPGTREFLTALHNFQPQAILDEDPVMAVEVLCLLTIYAQATDMHRMAYVYIGQASRIARAWKLDLGVTDNVESHTQRLWLTVCAIDQRLSATIGASPDTTVQPGFSIPSNTYPDNVELRLNLSLANMLSRVAKVLSKYRVEDSLESSFINEITQELTDLRRLGEQMKNVQPLCSNASLLTISRQAATFHLLFYQSIIICTRPVLMCLMKPGLDKNELIGEQNAPFEAMFKTIRTCINASINALSIVSALYEQSLLETFMPLDMEMTFLAALCLTIANKVFPNSMEPSFIHLAQTVLQYMSHKGSVPACQLQKELESLCGTVLDDNVPTNLPTNYSLLLDTFLNKRVDMIRDGMDLTNALDDVIEIQSPNHSLTSNAPESMAHSQPRPLLEVPTLTTTTMAASLQSSHEFQMDGIGPVDNSFSFDMADLQWLDNVQ